MPAIAAAGAIVGAGIAIYGDLQTASDQASLDQQKASVAEQQSQEIFAREQTNEALRQQQAYRQKLQFGASYAASGKAGVGIGSQLQIQLQADTQNAISGQEAAFQEKMLQQQAGVDTTLAAETSQAGTINALGAGIGGLARAAGPAAQAFGMGGKQGLGAYPSTSGG